MLCVLLGLALQPSQGAIDPKLAARYFQEARWIADDDNGALWGRRLDGPMVFVDRGSRTAVANENPGEAGFQMSGGVFTGRLPEGIGVANYAFEWGGKRWTMLMWPLPSNRAERARLMMHELFHRVQPDLGLQAASPTNAHLESKEGRVWLRLEMRALAQALEARSARERTPHASRAIQFRHERWRRFPSAEIEENALELNEGLCEYTGYMLRGGFEPETRLWAANQLRANDAAPSFARSFAYWTGCAYAYLLNVEEAVRQVTPNWRTRVRTMTSLSDGLQTLLRVEPVATAEARKAAEAYGLEAIEAEETKRAIERAELERRIKAELIDGPHVVVPLKAMRFTFDPNGVYPFVPHGTYYPKATIIDSWGTLEVSGGVLIDAQFQSAHVGPPLEGSVNEGKGWSLKLAEGWRVVKEGRNWKLTGP